MEHIVQEFDPGVPNSGPAFLCLACGEWVDCEDHEEFEDSPCSGVVLSDEEC